LVGIALGIQIPDDKPTLNVKIRRRRPPPELTDDARAKRPNLRPSAHSAPRFVLLTSDVCLAFVAHRMLTAASPAPPLLQGMVVRRIPHWQASNTALYCGKKVRDADNAALL
jgi:hypothetical protein